MLHHLASMGSIPPPFLVEGTVCRAVATLSRHLWGMATRESWTVDLRCPACGANGAAQVSEDDHPLMPSRGALRVDSLPDGFRVRRPGNTMRTTQFECIRCGMVTQR
jgi:hypothetical protein